MDPIIISQDYQDIKGRVDKELVLLKDKLTDLRQQTSPFKIYNQKEVSMMEKPLEYYRKSDGATKKKLLSTIFAVKLVLEKGKVVKAVFTESIQLIIRISDVLGSSEKKKEVEINQSLVATLTKKSFSEFKSCSPLLENYCTSHPLN